MSGQDNFTRRRQAFAAIDTLRDARLITQAEADRITEGVQRKYPIACELWTDGGPLR